MNPSELGIGITSIKKAREGSVIIKCRSQEEANKLRTNLDSKIGQNYVTRIPDKKMPRIKIVGFEEEYDEQELISRLKRQNIGTITTDSEIKLIVSKKMVKTHFAIIECDPGTYAKVIQDGEGRLYLDCRSCRCYEYLGVIRCYNCNGYNHIFKDCKERKLCANCGNSGHDAKDCKNNPECSNCKLCNTKYKLNLKTTHGVYDVQCPTYQRYQDKERQKTQYTK